jgi:hypothetical protein
MLQPIDIKDILNSQLALGIVFGLMVYFVLLPLNANINSMVVEFKELNANMKAITQMVNNHDGMLKDLTAEVKELQENK